MMMYWGAGGWIWMAIMPVLWLVLIGAVVWAVVRLTQQAPGHGEGRGARRESPEEILQRRFASGEIDAETYVAARDCLVGDRASAPPRGSSPSSDR